MKKRIIVGITGASGTVYAVRLLEIMLTMPLEIHLIVSAMGWISCVMSRAGMMKQWMTSSPGN